ncbi:MAG TPA: hypothetical protein VKV17_05075 [Bryobacteraceae bacterium]|nr:hypothetical protein [Bryobacteraceae bacterium]
MSWQEFESSARRNQLEAIIVNHHKEKQETGEAPPIPPLDQLPGDPVLKSATPGPYKLRALNALRHGLTGQAVLMPWEDRVEYDNFCRNFIDDLKPAGFEQTQLAQTIADCQWRLNRASAYESAIFHYYAYLNYQGLHEGPIEEEMSKARAAESTQKHLLNITLYESRLQRKMINARKALQQLQKEQSQQPQPAQPPVEQALSPANHPPDVEQALPPANPPSSQPDFVFSNPKISHATASAAASENPFPAPDPRSPQPEYPSESKNLLK